MNLGSEPGMSVSVRNSRGSEASLFLQSLNKVIT